MSIASNIDNIKQTIDQMETKYKRPPSSVRLLAVTKGRSTQDVLEAINQGLTDFGENYCQEALAKIHALSDYALCWHFIGPMQQNKTKKIAQHFSWVHSVCRLDIAEQLGRARPATLNALNICIQINLDEEPTKAGITADELIPFAKHIINIPNLCLRGLMMIPKPETNPETRYQTFLRLAQLLTDLNQALNLNLDTLSMGMSDDLTEAVHAGSTYVRIGRSIFNEKIQS